MSRRGVDLASIELPDAAPQRIAVRVNADALRQIRGGHPWVYDASITAQNRDGAPGDLTVVFDDRRRFVAIGLYDPTSPIRVNLLHRGEPRPLDESWWHERVAEALARREPLIERGDTDAYRVIHGENDGLGGVIVDRYASVLVVKIYSPAWFAHLRHLLGALDAALRPSAIVVRFARRVAAGTTFGLAEGQVVAGVLETERVRFRENGLVFEADVRHGQKTGHFLDQRDNRRRVRERSRGAEVLDVFSCTGGFTVHAAAGGATEVTSVDSSAHATDATRCHLKLNAPANAKVAAARWHPRHGDAFEVLEEFGARQRRFDLVVIDPPSFAARRRDVGAALHAYGRLCSLGLTVLRTGGTLVQASCSSQVSPDDLTRTLHDAATASGVRLRSTEHTGHGIDHPVNFAQGAYLSALFARVER